MVGLIKRFLGVALAFALLAAACTDDGDDKKTAKSSPTPPPTDFASPVALGSGSARGAHGVIPVPGPAVLELLAGVPVQAGPVAKEMCTPTGAAADPPASSGRVARGRRGDRRDRWSSGRPRTGPGPFDPGVPEPAALRWAAAPESTAGRASRGSSRRRAALLTEVILTAFFLYIILGATDQRALDRLVELGAEVKVPTLGGAPVTLRLPAGTGQA